MQRIQLYTYSYKQQHSLLSYHFSHKHGTVDTSRLDVLEEVDHSLHLQTLQLGMDADEGAGATHSITIVYTA